MWHRPLAAVQVQAIVCLPWRHHQQVDVCGVAPGANTPCVAMYCSSMGLYFQALRPACFAQAFVSCGPQDHVFWALVPACCIALTPADIILVVNADSLRAQGPQTVLSRHCGSNAVCNSATDCSFGFLSIRLHSATQVLHELGNAHMRHMQD